jgi:ketosteroid isomerase-like protein
MAGTDDPIAEVERRERAFYAAQTASDVVSLDDIMSDAMTTFGHSTGVVDTKAEYLEGVRAGRYRHGPICRLNGSTRVIGDAAVTIGLIDLMAMPPGAPARTLRLQQVLVWEKENGKWRLYLRQATALSL